MSESTEQMIKRILERYNPDHDLAPPSVPEVTWTDRQLLAIVEHQQGQISVLREMIGSLRHFVITGESPLA